MSTQRTTRGDTSVDSIRAKLWSCGFKVSSNTIKNFVDYIADQEDIMYDSDTSEMQSTTSTIEDIHPTTKTPHEPSHATTKSATETTDTTAGQLMEHRLTVIEQEIASLQHTLDAFIAEEEKEQDTTWHCSAVNIHPEDDTIAEETESLHQERKETPPKGRIKHARKSDPVSMYHKMQSLWCKNKFLAHNQPRN
ncbi:hypothetical protein PSENEW3n2_00003917 [Picochlorum sp. SENEW3]|nr:hypothetical protein PSENEW3n2_00003917 [Picochlorum sp. SENEW3]WPT18617.1 hypothetical protein PSENEW3_00003917 [Picochlorum sp. SENEW3]